MIYSPDTGGGSEKSTGAKGRDELIGGEQKD